MPPVVIGFTGQIGSGKSTAGLFFEQLGVPVIDTDQLARDVVSIDSPAYRQIVAHFGSTIVLPDQSLNRRLLRQKIFADPLEKAWLEQCLHPLIADALQQKLLLCDEPYAIVLIPLLIGRPRLRVISRILVIDSDHQQERVIKRDNIDAALFHKMVEAQPTREQLRLAADDLLINNGDLQALQQQILTLHHRYLQLKPDDGLR